MANHIYEDDDFYLDQVEYYEELFAHPGRRRKQGSKARRRQASAAEVARVAEATGLEGGFNPTYRPGRFEAGWLLESLRSFYEQHLITDVLANVKGGKEASVYCCAAAPTTGAAYATAALAATDATGPGATVTASTDTAPAPDAAQPGSDRSGSGSWGSSWDGGWTGGSAGGAGGGWGAGSGWDGSQPPPAPVPPQPGPGSRATSLVLAVALLTAAGIALAHQQGVLDANPWLVGGGAVLAVLGAGVLVSGMRGRTQGGIGVLALLLAIVVVPAAAAAAALPGFARIGTDATTWAGDPTWAPRTAADAESGYSLVAGQLVVDLSQLEEDADVTVPTSVTFGNLYVIVPDGADVTVNASVGAGEIVGPLDDDWSGPGMPVWGATRTDGSLTNGVGISATLVQEGDGSGPQITVDAEVSFGQLHIEETS
ncbi:MAG TPA: hypothetical protein VKZ83_16135 [Phototrophicaceae bacterium]|nr:hypothetical protein [Phototrophicaceae bacterium]